MRGQNFYVGLTLAAAGVLIVWLLTKMARTPKADFRLEVIGGSIVVAVVILGAAAFVQRQR
jgi:hypothetical protein